MEVPCRLWGGRGAGSDPSSHHTCLSKQYDNAVDSNVTGQGERHYLRILLGVVKGATSFEDLRTHAGVKHNTFKQAAIARGLLEHDAAQKQIMRDGAVLQFPLQLRNTFAELLAWEDVMNPVELWEEFKHDMCKDVLYRHRQAC